jgi:hypothetical protein
MDARSRSVRLAWIPLAAALALAGARAPAAERVLARESFAYRGTMPIALDGLGSDSPGWSGPWRANAPLAPVDVDRHTINNPFGSGEGTSHRASNQRGEIRSSVRRLERALGEAGTTVQIGFAMMQHLAPSQDGECGGIELLRGADPVLFAGDPLRCDAFALAVSHGGGAKGLRETAVKAARTGELFKSVYVLATIDFEDGADRATLQVYDVFGLPLCDPVSRLDPDLSFDRLAVYLDDQQVDEIQVRFEDRRRASPIHYRPPGPGRLADTIPFYWNGEYHIFYLRAVGKVPWEHIVSRDLLHWKALPAARTARRKVRTA